MSFGCMEYYSIYIHFPFCLKRCPYCDFFSSVSRDIPFKVYGDALEKEWELRRSLVESQKLISVYLGGGTPSLWPASELRRLLKLFPLSDDVEVTVEANPGDEDRDWFKELADSGVTRFSIGVQALDEARLQFLGRRHTARQARLAVTRAKKTSVSDVNADIIYGTPLQRDKTLIQELNELVELGVLHISAYELTLSHSTPMYSRLKREGIFLPGETENISLYQTVGKTLKALGLPRYEISNYAGKGFECRHNVNYWSGGVYVGLGLGAYGFLLDQGGSLVRYANLGTLENYIEEAMRSSGTGKTDGLGQASTRDILSKLDSAREKMMLGLRMTRGAPFEEICENLPTDLKRKWEQISAKLVNQGLVQLEEGRLRATESGLLIADSLAEEFF